MYFLCERLNFVVDKFTVKLFILLFYSQDSFNWNSRYNQHLLETFQREDIWEFQLNEQTNSDGSVNLAIISFRLLAEHGQTWKIISAEPDPLINYTRMQKTS